MRFIEGLFMHAVERQPRIVALEKPIRVLGMEKSIHLKAIYRDLPELGGRFDAFRKAHPTPYKKDPWGYAVISMDYDETTQVMTILLGDVVTRIENPPPELTPFEIPPGTYAVFRIRPKNRLGWPVALAVTKRFIYTEWLPKSGYQSAGRVNDFEYHDSRSERKKDPEIELFVSIAPLTRNSPR